MRSGRPRKYEKRENRKFSVRLDLEACLVLDRIRKERPMFDFSRYVTEVIKRDFSNSDIMIDILRYEIGLQNVKIQALERERDINIEKIKRIKDKKKNEMEEIING